MPVLDCKKDKNNNVYFFWLDDSKKEKIQYEGNCINIFEMLEQALSQVKTKPGYQEKSYLISQKFSKLLNAVPDLKEPIFQ